MRIAQVAPPFEAVPPAGYGGTERVVHYLTEELVRLGHEVTLFASGDSRSRARLVSVTPRALRPAGVHNGVPCILQELHMVAEMEGEFDLIHSHVDYYAFPFAAGRHAPVVHTLHGRLDIPDIAPIFHAFRSEPLVSISNSQRSPLPDQNWVATVYHGLPPEGFPFSPAASDYLLFLGRMSPEKRPDLAIEIAGRAGLPLVMAAKIDHQDESYWNDVVRPLLARSPRAVYLGEVGDEMKANLLAGAIALLMPVDWPEPFGLTAIESLACGTPVITRPCGALPELVTDGVDGWVRDDPKELAALIARIGDIDRAECRRTFERRFTDAVMAANYVDVYQRILEARVSRAAAAPVTDWVTVDSALAASIPKHVLKGNHAFVVVDPFGDVPDTLQGEFGFYHRGTRYVSCLNLRVNGETPCLLGTGADPQSNSIVVDAGNERLVLADGRIVEQNAIHLRRELKIARDELVQSIAVRNYSGSRLPVEISIRVGADFADIFEVRGTIRKHRGRTLGFTRDDGGGTFDYFGLDGVRRQLRMHFDQPPAVMHDGENVWRFELDAGAEWVLHINLAGRADELPHAPFPSLGRDDKTDNWVAAMPRIETSDEMFTAAIRQAVHDLGELMSTGVDGLFPTAGIPWYGTLFGRDSIITALQLIPWNIDTAVSTFLTLANYQAGSFDDFTDREPGKILHEWREGEMANLREIPFIPYFGTIDATLLFIHLGREIYAATANAPLLHRMWPHLVRAYEWLEKYGSIAGDGFVDYECRSPIGLRNQGWKDSWDAVSHRDGALAEAPIALIEVQAYAWLALRDLAELATAMHDADLARRCREKADRLRDAVDERFWMEEESTYGLALDGSRRLCCVVASNAGHALFTGMPDEARGRAVARRLMQPDVWSGFGIRTLSQSEKRFNPMSYHNGSIWPHDNGMIAEGLRRYGLYDEMSALHRDLLHAIYTFPLGRVPELYCGFDKTMVRQPVTYPTACAPQAWASGTVLMMLTQMLGLRVDAAERKIVFGHVRLPGSVEWMTIRGLRIGKALHDFTIRRDAINVDRADDFSVVAEEAELVG